MTADPRTKRVETKGCRYDWVEERKEATSRPSAVDFVACSEPLPFPAAYSKASGVTKVEDTNHYFVACLAETAYFDPSSKEEQMESPVVVAR